MNREPLHKSFETAGKLRHLLHNFHGCGIFPRDVGVVGIGWRIGEKRAVGHGNYCLSAVNGSNLVGTKYELRLNLFIGRNFGNEFYGILYFLDINLLCHVHSL